MNALADPIHAEIAKGAQPRQPIATEPPNNLPAEAAVLGALMFDNNAFDRIEDILAPDHFYAPAHETIYTTCVQMIKSGRPANGVTLREFFEKDARLAEVGGAEYLADLLDSACFGPEISDYAHMVADLACRRLLLAVGQEIASMADKPEQGETATVLLDKARNALAGVEEADRTHGAWEAADEALGSVLEEMEHRLANGLPTQTGLTTGLPNLDMQIGGMQGGDLIVLAGRPSMGKTALASNILFGAAVEAQAKVAFFSQEMTREQLAYRVGAQQARLAGAGAVAYRDLRNGHFDQHKLAIIRAGLARVPKTVAWDCSSKLTASDVRARCRALRKRLGGLDLIVVDYLQIMDLQVQRGQSKADAVGMVTLELKEIAKTFNVPVIVLSQLSRALETRDDKRPMLSDLRDSGSIEQDADIVMFAYRDEYYLERSEPDWNQQEKWNDWSAKRKAAEGQLDIIVGKNRMGAPGTVTVYFEPATDAIVSKKEQLTEETLL